MRQDRQLARHLRQLRRGPAGGAGSLGSHAAPKRRRMGEVFHLRSFSVGAGTFEDRAGGALPETVQENAERSLCGTVSAGGRDAAQAGWREPAVGSAAGLLRRRHLRVRRNAVPSTCRSPSTRTQCLGTNVTSDSNGDWLNVYANYDLETGGPGAVTDRRACLR